MASESNASASVVLGGIVLIAAGMLLAIFNAPGLSLPQQVSAPAQHARPAAGRASTGPAADRLPEVTYAAGTLRDPMANVLRTLEAQAESDAVAVPERSAADASQADTALAPVPAVQALVWGGGRAQALIDGQLYRVGATIGSAKILAITREGVTVSIGGNHQLWQPIHPLQLPSIRQGGQP